MPGRSRSDPAKARERRDPMPVVVEQDGAAVEIERVRPVAMLEAKRPYWPLAVRIGAELIDCEEQDSIAITSRPVLPDAKKSSALFDK